MHSLHLDRIRLLEVKDASRVAHNILKPRREDREHIAQIQASADRLSYFVKSYNFAMRVTNMLEHRLDYGVLLQPAARSARKSGKQ